MAKGTADSPKAQKMFSADIVAALLMSTGTTSITTKSLDLMSALDGVKTRDALQHDFRSVIAKSKELKARVDSGEVFEPVKSAKKRGTYLALS